MRRIRAGARVEETGCLQDKPEVRAGEVGRLALGALDAGDEDGGRRQRGGKSKLRKHDRKKSQVQESRVAGRCMR